MIFIGVQLTSFKVKILLCRNPSQKIIKLRFITIYKANKKGDNPDFKIISFALLWYLNYLKTTPNFDASALASGINLFMLAILVASDGCVLINSGGLLPPLLAAILSQNAVADSGL